MERPERQGETPNELTGLLKEYQEIFTPLKGLPPTRDLQLEIDLVPGAKPVMKRPYRLSESETRELEKQIVKALEEGWVQPSRSAWGTAIFVVGKKNGEYRMCVDYRSLNALTEQDAYPLPRIDDILHRVAKGKVYSTLDLQSGYHQIWIRKQDVAKTAFRLARPIRGTAHYEWRVMPFGLKNAPPTFQRFMAQIFEGCTHCSDVYMDDIIVYSESMQQHERDLRLVLQTLRDAQLKVNINKCTFGAQEVEFLGHVLREGQIWMQPAKQEDIKNWEEPLKTARQVRQFLGLASYYRNYVKDFSKIAAPLIALTRKRATIQWTWEIQQAFHKLKAELCSVIGRRSWDHTKRTRVTTDASGSGLGAVLEQLHDQEWHTVAVWSRTLNTCQGNYSILDKEWLAIMEAVTRIWKHWLTGITFEIQTDHAPLCQILTKKVEELTPRQLRWLERLEAFSFTIKYIKGEENLVADALSRNPAAVETRFVRVIEWGALDEGRLVQEAITQAATQDEFYQQVLQEELLQLQLEVTATHGLLLTAQNQIYVPLNRVLRFQLILEFHDQPFAGHWNEVKTHQLIARYYFWPTLSKDVEEVVRTCDVCQRARVARARDKAPIRFLEAQYPWEVVTLDFVSGFTPTRRKHTTVCVICDRFTRMIHLESCKDHATAQETARIVLRQLFAKHGCPRIIISDRGAQFDSELWKSLWNYLGTRVQLASTHHPQTNGLTERMNRTLITMIKKIPNPTLHQWDEALPMFEFAYNQTPNSTTGVAPFLANQGYIPSTPAALLAATCVPPSTQSDVHRFIAQIRETYREIHTLIQETENKQQQQIMARENKRRGAPQFAAGDEVLMYWPPFETYSDRPRKHRFRYEGPFMVKTVISPHCVSLEGLPERMPTTINVEYLHLYRRTSNQDLQTARRQKQQPLDESTEDAASSSDLAFGDELRQRRTRRSTAAECHQATSREQEGPPGIRRETVEADTSHDSA